MRIVKIYTLAHPVTKEIRYIGKTRYSLSDRLCKHMITYERNHRANWIRMLKKEGLKPIIELLQEVPEDQWIECEKYWIAQFKAWGFRLLNLTEGGESGIISEACREGFILKVKGSRRSISAVQTTTLKLNRPVLQFTKSGDFIQEFPSASQAAREVNGSCSHITECCNSITKRKSHKGFKWKYKNGKFNKE